MVGELAKGLDSGTLLPFPIRAKVLHTDYRLPFGERDLGVDLLVEFSTDNRKVTATIQCKSHLTPVIADSLLYGMHRTEAIRRSSALRDAKLMIAAPYISDPLRKRFKEAGVGYIDLNGTFYLADGGVYIDIVKPAGTYRNPQGTKNIFAGKSRRLIRVLLAHPYTPFRLGELAKTTELSVAQAFQVFRRLEQYQVIERNSAGRQLVRPRKLLNVFSTEIKRDYQSKREIFYGFYDGKAEKFTSEISQYCVTTNIEFAFTLFSGLEPHERNVIENLTALYVSEDPNSIAANLGLPFASMGANTLLMRAPTVDNTAAGGVFYEPRTLSNQVRAVNLIQAYLDFALYPGRGEEQARFLLDRYLGFRE